VIVKVQMRPVTDCDVLFHNVEDLICSWTVSTPESPTEYLI
jgi:hypothetical protein